MVSGINLEERFLFHRSSLRSDLVLEDERCRMETTIMFDMASLRTQFFDSR